MQRIEQIYWSTGISSCSTLETAPAVIQVVVVVRGGLHTRPHLPQVGVLHTSPHLPQVGVPEILLLRQVYLLLLRHDVAIFLILGNLDLWICTSIVKKFYCLLSKFYCELSIVW